LSSLPRTAAFPAPASCSPGKESRMSVEFIGMIQSQQVSETHAASGPVVDRD